MLKKSLIFFALLFAFFNPSFSQLQPSLKFNITVGNEPVGVFYDDTTHIFHIFCKGTDKNFNGVFEPDSGDVKPTWWTVSFDNTFNPTIKQVYEFEFGSIQFPFRPAFAQNERKIYLNHLGIIQAYSLDSFTPIEDESYSFFASGIDYKNKKLFVTKSSLSNQIDTLIILNTLTKSILNQFPIGINAQQTLALETNEPNKNILATLNIGTWGSDSSNIIYGLYDNNNLTSLNQIYIGNTGNHISTFGNKYLIATSMFSNKIFIIDISNNSVKIANSQTSPWGGPSFSKIVKFFDNENNSQMLNYLATVNYDGFIEFWLIDNVTKEIIDNSHTSFEIDGKGEAFDYSYSDISGKISTNLLIANSVKADYSSNNTLTFMQFSNVTTVENNNVLNFEIYPNPAKNYLNINIPNSLFDFKIIDRLGNEVIKETNILSKSQIDLTKLNSGVYFLLVSSGNNKYFEKIEIIK
ncbi:MAG: T9SS type A sorting domain-containing protein [Candidatus Kapaibacteriota bacterium]